MIRGWLKRMLGTSDPPKTYSIDTTVPRSNKNAPVKVTWPKDKKSGNP